MSEGTTSQADAATPHNPATNGETQTMPAAEEASKAPVVAEAHQVDTFREL
jgi:hypothetical protein